MLEKLIDSENTDSLYEEWTSYRKELTDFIINSIEGHYIKELLCKYRLIRPDRDIDLGKLIREQGCKPILAIWGAGGCNDMDLQALSVYFRLVLIDRDVEILERARKRFELTEDECLCADLQFFDISMEDYSLFEAMLCEQLETEKIIEYLQELGDNLHVPDYRQLPVFDFSVDVGLSSQLVSRLAAISKLHGRLEELSECLARLGRLGIRRLEEAMYRLTGRMLIHGYELETFSDKKELRDRYDIDEINHELERQPELKGPLAASNILGNDYYIQLILSRLSAEELKVYSTKVLEWSFINGKVYLMGLLSLEKMQYNLE